LCGVGHCCNSTDAGFNNTNDEICCCENGFTGVLCAIPPGEKECTVNSDCVASNKCTVASCNASGSCVFSSLVCPSDNNACTNDTCVNEVGCVYTDLSELCNDHLECTTDSCDKVTGRCTYLKKDCSAFKDICHNVLCNDYEANVSLQCVPQSVLCRVDNNCTSSECLINHTFDQKQGKNISGCKNTTFDCNFQYFGVVAGLVAGAIVGIVIAAALVFCGAMAGGGAYAISQTSSSDHHNKVKVNPLYRPHGKSSAGINCD